MKKILISLMVIAVAVGLVGVSVSGAWFSDVKSTATNPGPGSNLVAAGTIELDDLSGSVVVEDLKPCQIGYGGIWVRNLGNPGPAWLHIYNVVGSDGICSDPEYVIGGCDINDIQDWTTVDLSIGWDRDGGFDVDPWEKEIIIPEANDVKLSSAECFWIPLGPLETNRWYWVEFSFHIQPETGNAYQGDEATFDIEVMLQQEGAPSPNNGFPLGMKTIRLENKDTTKWEIIPDDGIYGLINYWVGSDLHIKLIAKGLEPNTLYQMKLQGPVDTTCASTTNSQLASGVQGHGGTFDAGYWTGSGGLSTTCSGQGQGIYNFGYECADANGEITKTFVIETGGATWPALPAGTYSDVEMLVVKVENTDGSCPGCVEPISLPWPDSYTGILMGTGVNLGFTIP